MKLIAHRGNTNGPLPYKENSPQYIIEALAKGYDVEIDIWLLKGGWFLGHNLDGLLYRTYVQFLQNPSLWVHAKNIDALNALVDNKHVRVFWHQNDDVTLTSDNYIWGFHGGTSKSIIVVPDDSIPTEKCYGICSDYVDKIKTLI